MSDTNVASHASKAWTFRVHGPNSRAADHLLKKGDSSL
jgi:hypothetical protein